MKPKKITCLFLSFILFSVTLIGQTNPPPMAMPVDSNVAIIDKIIEVTMHKNYFVSYCSNKVKKHALENNWPANKTKLIIESIEFEDYNSTIYNSYAFYTNSQLKTLLNALTLLNKNGKSSTMILSNFMMQNNLDLYVESIIEGKYLKVK